MNHAKMERRHTPYRSLICSAAISYTALPYSLKLPRSQHALLTVQRIVDILLALFLVG
jgi:hypothetical protein